MAFTGDPMTDAEREAQIRKDAKTARNAILPSNRYAVHHDVHFLLRLLDEARAEITIAHEAIQTQNGVVLAGTRRIVALEAEIARLQAPLGASAMERAKIALSKNFVYTADGHWSWAGETFAESVQATTEDVAHAIEQTEREARAAALDELGFGRIVMMSEQRAQPGEPSRWCALARDSKQAVIADSEQEARIRALAAQEPKPSTSD
jgi:hypothetical protein